MVTVRSFGTAYGSTTSLFTVVADGANVSQDTCVSGGGGGGGGGGVGGGGVGVGGGGDEVMEGVERWCWRDCDIVG